MEFDDLHMPEGVSDPGRLEILLGPLRPFQEVSSFAEIHFVSVRNVMSRLVG